MKPKKKSTLIAILMSVLLCLSIMPMTAFAGGNSAPVITNAGGLPFAVEGKPYEYTFAATAEGTVTWEKDGTWPSWLELDSSTGKIHGTPTSNSNVTAGIKATCIGSDGVARTDTKNFYFNVFKSPEIEAKQRHSDGHAVSYIDISGTNLPDATQNSDYLGADKKIIFFSKFDSGWDVMKIEGAPEGMNSYNGTNWIDLDGTPTNAGTYSIKVTLSTYADSAHTQLIGTTENTFTLKVNPDGSTTLVTISFDKNGGDGTMAAVTKNAGETYVLPACAFTAPAGKEFKAWEVNGAQKAVGDSITVNADTTVKALWKQKPPVTYTVSFDKNGGSGTMADVTKNAGETYVLPACAFTAPAGKEFKAWEVGGVEKAPNDSITVNANTTVKAIWKQKPPVTYTVSFDKNGGSGTMADVTKNAGETYVLPACAFTAPAGKEFKAWEVGGVEKAPNDSITVNANTTVKAIWKQKPPVTYTVSFDKNGGDGSMPDVTKNAGETYVLPACAFIAPAGKEFKAWEVGGAQKAPNDSITVNANTTVKAIWKDKTVTVNTSVITIKLNSGKWADGTTAPKTYAVEVGEYFTLPEAPIRDGYTFLYWEGSRYNPGDKYKVTGTDHTFTAVWEKNGVRNKKPPKTGVGTDTPINGIIAFFVTFVSASTFGFICLNDNKRKNANN